MEKKYKKVMMLFILLLVSGLGFSQIKISGKVTDGKESLPGVSVYVKGSRIGVETDIDGKYTINVKKGQTLVFQYLGFKSQEIRIQNQTKLDVILKEDTEVLEEVIVAFRK